MMEERVRFIADEMELCAHDADRMLEEAGVVDLAATPKAKCAKTAARRAAIAVHYRLPDDAGALLAAEVLQA